MFCYHCMREKGNEKICPYCHNASVPGHASYQLAPGTKIKDYVFGKVIGEGGLSINYIGYDTVRGNVVVIEELYPGGHVKRDASSCTIQPGSPESSTVLHQHRHRFLERGKRLMSAGGAGAIVRVRDCFAANNTVYTVSDYLSGVVLKDFIKLRGKLEAELAFSMFKPLMTALDQLHRTGLILCDIRPDAIMVNNYSLTLFDFSSAILLGDQNAAAGVSFKYGYAAPELYEKTVLGAYTDVYGLCAVMYTCITGELPVDSVDRADGEALIPPSQKNCAIHPELEAILMDGLNLDPKKRIQTMAQLLFRYEGHFQKEQQKEQQKQAQQKQAQQKTTETSVPTDRKDSEPKPIMPVPKKKKTDSNEKLRRAVNAFLALTAVASAGLAAYLFLAHPNLWDSGIKGWWQCSVLQLILCVVGLIVIYACFTSEDHEFKKPMGIAVLLVAVIAVALTFDIFTRIVPGNVDSGSLKSRISSSSSSTEKAFLESVQFLDEKLDINNYAFPDFYFRDYISKNQSSNQSSDSVKSCTTILKKKKKSTLNDFVGTVYLNADKLIEIELGKTTVDDLIRAGLALNYDSAKLAANKSITCHAVGDSTINIYVTNRTNTEKNVIDCTVTGIEDDSHLGDYLLTYRYLGNFSDFDEIISELGKPNDNIGVSCRTSLGSDYSQIINFDYQYMNGHTVKIYYDYLENTVDSFKISF